MCLAHLNDTDRAAYLGGLAPGSRVDHRGTTFAEYLLDDLLDALRDPDTAVARLGGAQFIRATFTTKARFRRVNFTGWTRFDGAVFSDDAMFLSTTFSSDASFDGATFSRVAAFDGAMFLSGARFDGAIFSGEAAFLDAAFSGGTHFREATFSDDASFNEATFSGTTQFDGSAFAGRASFGRATFAGRAWFGEVAFASRANFNEATFSDNAWFNAATFSGDVSFSRVTFTGEAWFGRTVFTSIAGFEGTAFAGDAAFHRTAFAADAWFDEAVFSRKATFDGATFSAGARFTGAVFEKAVTLGPLLCHGTLNLSAARFDSPMTLEAAATGLTCHRSRWGSTATLRLRHATVDLSDAVLEYPLVVTARPSEFQVRYGQPLDESALGGRTPGVRMASVSGVDAAHLVLADVDLSGCGFVGTVHLDQLRLEGRCSFASTPAGIHLKGLLPTRWTPRRTLAEEHHWRAEGGANGWAPAPAGSEAVGAAVLAPVYRQLRKSLEDGKNEPDAADFYYGEMEMRRHDHDRPVGERALLAVYWTLSGYGLRASRALGWLVAAMTVTVLALMLWGMPRHTPEPSSSGTITDRHIHFVTDSPDPVNPTGSLYDRLTGRRLGKSLPVVLNSVIFRSSGQDLTTAGTYIEMTSRLAEPVLLGLGLLAIRSRLKR